MKAWTLNDVTIIVKLQLKLKLSEIKSNTGTQVFPDREQEVWVPRFSAEINHWLAFIFFPYQQISCPTSSQTGILTANCPVKQPVVCRSQASSRPLETLKSRRIGGVQWWRTRLGSNYRGWIRVEEIGVVCEVQRLGEKLRISKSFLLREGGPVERPM